MISLKKIKILIIALIILLLIVTVFLLVIIGIQKGFTSSQGDEDTIIAIEEETINQEMERVNLFKIKNCITSYSNIINKNNTAYYGIGENGEYQKIISDEDIKSSIYDLLSNSYIVKNNITRDNVYEFVDDVNENLIFNVLDIKYYENNNSNQYVVSGYYQNIKNEFVKYAYYIVNINDIENIFSIEPILNTSLDINNLKVEDTTIEKNSNNSIPVIRNNNESICSDYLISFKRLMLSNPEEAYKLLYEEYKQKRFENIDRFKEYINLRKDEITKSTLSKYKVDEKDDYTQYVLIDQNGNYYIFNEKAVMDYKVILDTYTIDLPQFIEKYNNSSDAEKILLNIQKVFEAINTGDYRYVYNKLDATFKQNNFPTEDAFEAYVKQNFYKNNSIGYSNYKTSGDLHVYEISIKDKNNETSPTKTKNFIMQLKEGTDFVMSFNI